MLVVLVPQDPNRALASMCALAATDRRYFDASFAMVIADFKTAIAARSVLLLREEANDAINHRRLLFRMEFHRDARVQQFAHRYRAAAAYGVAHPSTLCAKLRFKHGECRAIALCRPAFESIAERQTDDCGGRQGAL